jgi:hypothetical protein
MQSEEKRRKDAETKRKSRAKKKELAASGAGFHDSALEVTDKEARQLLAARGIKNLHVIETCIDLAKVAARSLTIPRNAHLYSFGLQATLKANQGEVQPALEIEDVWYPGERIRLRDLYALWDYGCSWRVQADGRKLTFDEWRAMRRLCITDTMRFGNEILGKDFHSEPHGRWQEELYVKKNPDLLPENFTQKDIANALREMSPIHQRLLISSRNSYKSTWNLIDLLGWVLCFGGSIRILMCSATQPLTKGFLKSFRSYFTITNPLETTLFQQLWPEHCIKPGEDVSTSYTSPFRQLDALIEPTLSAVSVISEGQAGQRCDYLCFEDVAEISNSSTPEMRQKTLERISMLTELLEPTGYVIYVGTPISSGDGSADDPGDIYNVLLKREAERDESRMLSMICPAWIVNEGVNKEPYDLSLTADEVTLAFPSRLTFAHLKAKLKDNVKIFRQQALCSWVPDEEEGLKLNFDRDLLTASVVQLSAVPPGENYISVDVAYSQNKYADLSAISVVRLYDNQQAEKCMCVLTQEADRMRGSELAHKIVMLTRQYGPRTVLIEKTATWDLIASEINRAGQKYSTQIPIFWAPSSNVRDAKNLRLKALEILLYQGRLKFASGPYIDDLFAELQRLDGKKSTAQKKDDRADSLGWASKYLGLSSSGNPVEDAENKKLQEEQKEAALLRLQYQRIFGDNNAPPEPAALEAPQSPYARFGIPGVR